MAKTNNTATLAQLVELIGGTLEGTAGDTAVSGIGPLDEAGPDQIAVYDSGRYASQLEETRAAAVVMGRDVEAKPGSFAIVRVDDSLAAVRAILNFFAPELWVPEPGIDATAIIDDTAEIGRNVTIGAYCIISKGVRIGDNSILYHGCVIGEDSSIGEGSVMRSHAVIRERCTIGARATLYSGSVIGSDGFGFDVYKDGPVPEIHRIPQIGGVEIGTDFELGASSTVDRAKFGVTRIGNHVKIDNVCHVGHNCRIGHFCGLVAGSMLAGSANLGNGVMVWGQSGIVGHIKVADGTVVAAKSAVTKSTNPGEHVIGFPAMEYSRWARSRADVARLPKLKERVSELERKLAELEKRLEDSTGS